jgi:hypothetical protein
MVVSFDREPNTGESMGLFPSAETKAEPKQKGATLVKDLFYQLREEDSFVLFDASEHTMPTEHQHNRDARVIARLPPASAYGCKEYLLKVIGIVNGNGGGKVFIQPDGNDWIEPEVKEYALGFRTAYVRLKSDGIRTWWIVG